MSVSVLSIRCTSAAYQIVSVRKTAGTAQWKSGPALLTAGSTWSLAYARGAKTLYAGAFMKKHTGFGPSGTGAIYKVDPASASVLTAPAVGKSAGSFCVTFPVAAHSAPRDSVVMKPTHDMAAGS